MAEMAVQVGNIPNLSQPNPILLMENPVFKLRSTYRDGRGGHRGGCSCGRVVIGCVAVPQTAGPPRVGKDEGGLDQVVVRLDGVTGRLRKRRVSMKFHYRVICLIQVKLSSLMVTDSVHQTWPHAQKFTRQS